MKIILEPQVNIVGKTVFVPNDKYLLPDDPNQDPPTDHEKLGAFSAKVCYDTHGKDGRPVKENQRAIIEHAHGSIIEHLYTSLLITGITRGLSLELNRHRPFNISQRSTRYTKEDDGAIVLEPYYAKLYRKYNTILLERLHEINDNHIVTAFDGTVDLFSQMISNPDYELFIPKNLWIDTMKADFGDEFTVIYDHLSWANDTLSHYQQEVEVLMRLNPLNLSGFDLRKWARGKARNTLPHGLETRGVWTGNHRAWRWFIESRSSKHAEPEIRRLAVEIFNAVEELAPIYYEDFEVTEVYDDIPVLSPKYHKI